MPDEPRWGPPLEAAFFERDVHELAVALLGQVLVSEVGGAVVAGRIVEVEAYGGADDPACHADGGVPTPRTRSMFGQPGLAYVYRIYGMYDCLNVVAPRGAAQKAAAVLIRAVEPVAGLEIMKSRRAMEDPRKLASGPGRLCQALGVTRALDGHWLADAPLRVCRGVGLDERLVDRTPRIGLNEKTCGEATQWLWRYTVAGSRYLSR